MVETRVFVVGCNTAMPREPETYRSPVLATRAVSNTNPRLSGEDEGANRSKETSRAGGVAVGPVSLPTTLMLVLVAGYADALSFTAVSGSLCGLTVIWKTCCSLVSSPGGEPPLSCRLT